MTSMTAILSRSASWPLRHRTLAGRPDKAGRAAEFSGQFFQEFLEPALRNRLSVTALLRQENLHEKDLLMTQALPWSCPASCREAFRSLRIPPAARSGSCRCSSWNHAFRQPNCKVRQ